MIASLSYNILERYGKFVFIFFLLNIPSIAVADLVSDPPNETTNSKPFLDAPSTDNEATSIIVSGHKLEIPRNYLISLNMIYDKVSFVAEATFPEFHGATPPTLDQFVFAKRYAYYNIIVIARITYIRSVYEQIIRPNLDRLAHENGAETVAGLIKLKNPFGGESYVHRANPPEESVVVQCLDLGPAGRCRVDTELAQGVIVEYEYDKSLLPQWMEIHRGMLRLLQSFLIK